MLFLEYWPRPLSLLAETDLTLRRKPVSLVLRISSWSSMMELFGPVAITELSPKRVPSRTLKRGYISEFLDMARTVQPQGFAPQQVDDLDGFDYMEVASRVRPSKSWVFKTSIVNCISEWSAEDQIVETWGITSKFVFWSFAFPPALRIPISIDI